MIGIKIKKIRVSKNISPINVYSGIMSRSNYWKLEEGLISPSFETVIQLLQRINLDGEEFLMLLQHDSLLFYNQTKDQRNFFFKKKDAEGLLNLAQQLQQQYEPTGTNKTHQYPRNTQHREIFDSIGDDMDSESSNRG